MPRVLLILPTSTYRAPEFLAAAARLGVEVVTASEQPQALASVMGDHFLHLPIDDPEQAAETIATFAARVPLDAVVGVDDRGALAAALGAAALKVAGNDPEAVRATTDKSLLRARLAAAGVSQPSHLLVPAGESRHQELLAGARALLFPVVLKPLGFAASRGVIRADDEEELLSACRRIEALLSECGRAEEALLLERYVPGAEVALEGLLDHGVLQTLCLFDKPDPLEGPFFEETIYVTPSRHPPEVQSAIAELAAAGCRALGLSEGPVHAELRLEQVGEKIVPVLIEIAARTIGGRCAKALQFATGERLEELVLKQAIGQSEQVVPRLSGAAGVMMLPIAHSGRLVEVRGRDEALAVEHIVGLEVAIPRGQLLLALPEGDRYLGFLFAAAPEAEQVEAALRAAHARLQVVIEAAPRLVGVRR